MPKSGRKSRKDESSGDTKPKDNPDLLATNEKTEAETAEEENDGLPKNVVAEIAKLKPDSKGLYTLRFKKPNPDFSKKDVENDFGHFGKLADIHFTDNFIYVRYNKRDEIEKAIRLMHDTYSIEVPHVSKGWNPKVSEELSSKLSKLSPDTRGWYSIRIKKPGGNFSDKDVETTCGKYGEISDIHFTDKFIYVRYLSWKEAANAIKNLDDKFQLDVPNVSNSWKPQKSHSDKGPQIYIGDISRKSSKEEIAELLEKYSPREFKFYSVNNRNFAFAYFENIRDCKTVVSDLNGKVVRGSTIFVRICRDRSRARIIADDDYPKRSGPDHRKGFRGDFNARSPFEQGIIELYVSNFNWNINQGDLVNLFQSHGQLAYVEIMPIHQASGECRKAYIGMYDAYEAKQAMHKLNQRSWNGLKLNVAYSTRRIDDAGKRGGGDGGQLDFHSNPLDRAYSISYKLDIMLEDVLDQCDFCVKIHGLMSDLQQAIRELKYQALRGEVMQGLSTLTDIIDQMGEREQQKQYNQNRMMNEGDFYGGAGSNKGKMTEGEFYSGADRGGANSSLMFGNEQRAQFYANELLYQGNQKQFYGPGNPGQFPGANGMGNPGQFNRNGAGFNGYGGAGRGIQQYGGMGRGNFSGRGRGR